MGVKSGVTKSGVTKSGYICPVMTPFLITQSYQEHLDYAAAHPEITYNGGIDLWNEEHTIRAAFAGKIDKVAYQANGYGNFIKIRHEWGYSLYAHLDRIYINVGDTVNAGSAIGLMGSTGFSTGLHLHFELRNLTEEVIDPSGLFEDDQPGQDPETEYDGSHLTAVIAPAGGNLRKTPLGEYLVTIPNGTSGKIIGGPIYKNGLTCYQVEFPVTGWMAESDCYGTKILKTGG